MDCYLCSDPLTPENDSSEHIIPNSIGGIREVKGFICRACNGKAGETWDTDLAKQLNKLALFFRVVRDRGENRAEVIETSAGEKLIYAKSSLKFFAPMIKKETKEDSVHFQISANDMNQARQILTGLQRSYPTLDVEKALASATAQSKYPDGYFNFDFSFGGLSVGKSFVKTALALLSVNGINPKICERANAYIFDDGEPCFGYYYRHDLLINRPVGVPVHCICVKGNKAERTVQAYLEYFGVVRIVISLSANYEGDDFKHSYAIDPIKGQEFTVDFDLEFDDSEVKKIYEYQFYDSQVISDAWHDVILPEMQRQQEQHLEEVLDKSREAMECRFSGSDHIDLEEFIAAYVDSLTPYIRHLANSRRIRDK
jgi:hypothetical protein